MAITTIDKINTIPAQNISNMSNTGFLKQLIIFMAIYIKDEYSIVKSPQRLKYKHILLPNLCEDYR